VDGFCILYFQDGTSPLYCSEVSKKVSYRLQLDKENFHKFPGRGNMKFRQLVSDKFLPVTCVIKQERRLHSGHGGITNCLDCGELILDPCAITDEDAGLSKMNVSPEWYDSRKPPVELMFQRGSPQVLHLLEQARRER
jgi:hypothetical protein